MAYRSSFVIALICFWGACLTQVSFATSARRTNFVMSAVNEVPGGVASPFSSECSLHFSNPSPVDQEISLLWRNPGSRVSGVNAGDGTSTITLAGATADNHVFTLAAGASQTLTITFPQLTSASPGQQTVTCSGQIIAKNVGAAQGFINVTGSLSSIQETPFSTTINGKPFTGSKYLISKPEVLINGGRPL